MHDVCAPIALAVSAPSDAQRAGIDAAIALWRDLGVTTIHVVDGVVDVAGAGSAGDAGGAGGTGELDPPGGAGSRIELRFEAAGGPFHGLYDDEAGVVYVNSAIEAREPLSIVIAHELGHAFGLEHVDAAQRRSLMNPGNYATPPNDADRAAVEALWGRCDRPVLAPR